MGLLVVAAHFVAVCGVVWVVEINDMVEEGVSWIDKYCRVSVCFFAGAEGDEAAVMLRNHSLRSFVSIFITS